MSRADFEEVGLSQSSMVNSSQSCDNELVASSHEIKIQSGSWFQSRVSSRPFRPVIEINGPAKLLGSAGDFCE